MRRRAASLGLLLTILASGSGAPPASPASGGAALRRLASELASRVADNFPLLEGQVVRSAGRLAEVRLDASVRPASPNVEFFRAAQDGAGSGSFRRIGTGRLLELRGREATVELLSGHGELAPGDRVRSSLDVTGIGIVLSSEDGGHEALLELLAVRVAHELKAQGRFRAELLGGAAALPAAGAPAEPALRAYLWRGLSYTLALSYVQAEGHATLLGRLYSLHERRLLDIVSARGSVGEEWPLLLASLDGSDAELRRPVQHRQAAVPDELVAVHVTELEGRLVVIGLGRAAVRFVYPQDGSLREERSVALPATLLAGVNARDFLGSIGAAGDGRFWLGHTLLGQSLSLEPGTGQLEPHGAGLWLGEQGVPLVAEYQSGANKLRSLRAGDGVLWAEPAGLRFAGWLGEQRVLLQSGDYQLYLLDAGDGQSRTLVAGPLGAGVSALELAVPLVAATSATEGGPDQVRLMRLERDRLELLWQSGPLSGPVRTTALALAGGQLHLAAVEALPRGSRLHLYSDLPLP